MQQDGANTSATSNPCTILNPIPEDNNPPSNVRQPKCKAGMISSQPTHLCSNIASAANIAPPVNTDDLVDDSDLCTKTIAELASAKGN
eukprot:7597319-Ditylum_brightwellii.AAC.1